MERPYLEALCRLRPDDGLPFHNPARNLRRQPRNRPINRGENAGISRQLILPARQAEETKIRRRSASGIVAPETDTRPLRTSGSCQTCAQVTAAKTSLAEVKDACFWS